MRTAQEIWESKKASGCTDYAILYATFARTLGVPTTLLHTAEYDWLQKLKNGEDSTMHFGHSFCECYFGDKWVLVDPTCKHIERNYNPKKLELSYKVGGKSVFIPYFRGLDLGENKMLKLIIKKWTSCVIHQKYKLVVRFDNLTLRQNLEDRQNLSFFIIFEMFVYRT